MNFIKSLLFSLIVLSCFQLNAQNYRDSLISIFRDEHKVVKQIDLLEEIIEISIGMDMDEALYYSDTLWKISKRTNNSKGLAISNLKKGKIYEIMGQFEKAKKFFNKSLEYYTPLGDKSGIAENEKHLGIILENQGKHHEAISHYLSALEIFLEINDKQGIASCKNSIGHVYFYLNNFKEALKYFNEALFLTKEINNRYAEAIVLNNIGLIHYNQKNFGEAMSNFQSSLDIHKELNNDYGASLTLTNIANVYVEQKNYELALKYHNQTLELNESLGDVAGISVSYRNIGGVYNLLKQYSIAIDFVEKALDISLEINDLEGIKLSFKMLYELYDQKGDLINAFDNYIYYSNYKDSILNETTNKTISELQELHNAEQREKEIELKDIEIAKETAEKEAEQDKNRKQQVIIFLAVGALIIFIILSFFLFRLFSQKKKANVELAHKNNEITEQKEVIEEKNRDIMASIQYAQRIQEAILPPDKVVKETLDNSFILFKPKDIVSGDFYWMDTYKNKILFSAVDCTGHGVPGAFMSIVGHNGLNQAVNEYNISSPGKILDKLNELVKETLHQTDKADVKDGMDLALCSLDLDAKICEYSGANNPLYLIRRKEHTLIINGEQAEPKNENETHNLFEIKATKQPIGAYDDTKDFENHVFELFEGDRIYVFSDGYADQFGGPKNKKFKYSTFKKLLLEYHGTPMFDQKALLNKTIEDWMGGVEQIDDICIIGVEI